MTMPQGRLKILLLDNGKEWGGGTNSLLELLKCIDRFEITCCFYHNQRQRVAPNARRIADLLRAGKYQLLYINNQPSPNVEGYLAVESLPVAVVQHCRIGPLLDLPIVARVNRGACCVIAVSDDVRQTLVQGSIRPALCQTVFNGIDIHQPLMEYLAAFDTPILASRSEGLPRVVLEAMLLETPIIGSAVTGTAEVVRHQNTGLFFFYTCKVRYLSDEERLARAAAPHSRSIEEI